MNQIPGKIILVSSQGFEFSERFCEVVQKFGADPIWYQNAGTDVKRSALDRGIRQDFYDSKIAVLLLDGGNPTNNWALSELPYAKKSNIDTIIFVKGPINKDQLPELPASLIIVHNDAEFLDQLSAQLNSYKI